jgi:hypothetical protein
VIRVVRNREKNKKRPPTEEGTMCVSDKGREAAIAETIETIRLEYRQQNRPPPSERELRRLAEEYFKKWSMS